MLIMLMLFEPRAGKGFPKSRGQPFQSMGTLPVPIHAPRVLGAQERHSHPPPFSHHRLSAATETVVNIAPITPPPLPLKTPSID